jgi:hypothetical protein
MELTTGTRILLVFSDCPSNRRCSPGQPIDNIVVVESPRTTDVFTMKGEFQVHYYKSGIAYCPLQIDLFR